MNETKDSSFVSLISWRDAYFAQPTKTQARKNR
jgi:hypothetical protein